MEIILALIALFAAIAALIQTGSVRRENLKVLEELKGLRDAVDTFEAPARGEAPDAVVNAANGNAETATPAPAAQVSVSASATASEEIPANILAVIAASVAGAIRGQYRILAIQAANTPPQVAISVPVIDWSLEGRREIYSSHKLR